MEPKWCFLLALVAGASAGPAYRDTELSTTCATTCPDTTKFSYETGKTYEYTYESDINTSIQGSSEEHSSLHVRATATVEVLAPCEMVLNLVDVSLQDSNPMEYESREHVDGMWDFKTALQERPLRFAFLDGRVDSVCPDSEEKTWVLNIKKGVLSGLQNTMESLDRDTATTEIDVAGECPVKYEVEGSGWGTTKVKKTKDLLGCTERLGHLTAFQSSPYTAHSSIQSLPLMKSTHECQQEFNSDRVLISTTCTESHVFRPFSRYENGASTSVTSKMTFVRMTAGVNTRQGAISKRDSMLFEHTMTPSIMEATARQVTQTLNQMCRASQEEITPEMPELFTKLVRQMHHLDTEAISTLFRDAKTICDKAEKYVRDAIPMTASVGTLNLIRELITSGEVSESEADIWLTHLAFIAQPTRDMLTAIKPLLDLLQPYRKASLAVSTMVHSYCRWNPDCGSDRVVREIIGLFEDKLRYNCNAENHEDHDLILMSLKALGNTGHAQSAVPTLNRCILNAEISTEIRVAAINAFRRMGCQADHTELVTLMTNAEEDAELRINAYLALMKCPSESTIDNVINMLLNEQVNQVGSFIWTHLTNLRESSDPHKEAIRQILDNKEIQKTFDLDKRKYSRNIEMSYFSELLNAGAQADANLIFSQNSFVPRSGMLNLTLDVFGESVNLLEIGGRVQGLERMLEKTFREASETTETTDDSINAIDSRYNLQPDEPQASYYLRVFGNEIRYGDLHDLDLASLQGRLNYLDWLIELAKEHNFQFTKSFMFLDATMSVPTIAGVPLCLKIDGTTVMNIDMSGKVDVKQMFANPSNFDIDGTIKPSAAVEVMGEMGVDAFVARTGVKMVTRIHTSTQAVGKIQMKNGKIFNLEISAPQGQKEIVKAESKFFIAYRNQDREQRMITNGRQQMTWCTGSTIETVSGMKICASADMAPSMGPNTPHCLLTGPSTVSLTVENMDTFRTYNIDYRMTRERSRTESDGVSITDTARLSLNTPGSRIDRELTAELIRTDMSSLTLNLLTPWKKVSMQGALTNTADMKRAHGTFSLDERVLFNLDAQVGINQKAVRTDLTPKVEISIGDARPLIIQGDIGYRSGKKIEVDMRMRNVFAQPVRVQGNIEASGAGGRRKYETDLQLNSDYLTGRYSGFTEWVRNEGATMNSEMSLEYAFKGMEQQRFTFSESGSRSMQGSLRTHSLTSSWTSTMWPQYNGQVSLDVNVDRSTLNVNLEGGCGDQRRIQTTLAATYNFEPRSKEVDGTLTFKYPLRNIDYSAQLGYLENDNQLRTTASVRYANQEGGNFELNLNRHSVEPMKVTADISLSYPGYSFSISDKIEERARREYFQDLLVKIHNYEDIRMSGTYKVLPRPEIDAEIQMPGYQTLQLKGHLNPELKNAQVKGEVIYGGHQYSAETSWVHRGNRNTFNTRGDISLTWPERRITMSGSASREGDVITTNMEGKWNAGVNEDKKINLDGQITITPTEPAIQMKIMVYPDHFVDLDMSGKYETQGWYRTSSDVEGSLHMRTSVQNWEDISARFKHDRTKTEYLTEGEVAWAPRKKITANFDIKKLRNWNKIESSMKLSTPFAAYEDVQMDVAYTVAANRFSTEWKMKAEDKVINAELNTELNKDTNTFNADIAFRSPFQNYENLRAEMANSFDGTRYRSTLEASWAPERAIRSMFSMVHQTDGNSMSNNGEMTLSTPYAELSSFKSTWQHQADASTIQSTANLEMNDEKIGSYEVEAKIKKTARNWNLDGRLVLDNPKGDNVLLLVDHQHDYKNFNGLKCESSIRWGDKTVALNTEMRRSAEAPLFLKSEFTSPFSNMEQIRIQTDTKKTEGHVTSDNEIQYGANKKVNLNADVTMSGDNVQGRVQFTSPYNPVERLVLNVRNQRDDGIWISHGDLEYQTDRRIEIDTQLGMGYRKVISAHIKSPCPYFQDAMFATTLTGTRRSFEATMEMNHERLASKITSTFMVNTADVNDMKISADILTPFNTIRFLKSEFNHRAEGNTIHTDAVLEVPAYKGSFTNDVTARNGRYLKTDTIVEYNTDKKIEVSTEFKKARKLLGSISVKTPFTDDFFISFNHEGPARSFTNEAEIRYSSSGIITANTNFNLAGTTLTFAGRYSTPYEQARRVVIGINHQGAMNSFTNEMSVQVNDLTLSGSSEFALSGTNMHSKAEFRSTTPLNGYTTISGEINHNGPATNFNNEATFTLGSKQVTMSSEMHIDGSSLSAKATMNLPLPELRTVSVDITHNGPITAFTNSAKVSYGNNEITGTSEFNLNGNTMTAKANIQTPFSKARNIAIELSHDGPIHDFRCNGMVQLNRKKVTASNEFHLRGNEMTAKSEIRLPMRDLRTLGFEISHSGPVTSFTNSATVTYGSEQLAANSEFSLQGNTMRGKATVTTPYEDYRTTSAEVNHDGSLTAFRNNIVIIVGNTEMTGNSRLTLEGNTLDGEITINTPYEGFRTTTLQVHHEGSLSSFRNNAVFTYANKEITGNSEFSLQGTKLSTKVRITTPYDTLKTISAEINHEGPAHAFKNNAVYVYGEDEVSANSEFRLRGSTLYAKAALHLPDTYMRTISVEVNHEGLWDNFNNNAVITYGNKEVTGNSEFSLQGTNLHTKVTITTPYDTLKTISAEINHEGPLYAFKNNAAYVYGDKEISANSEFNLQGSTLSAKAALNLPDTYMRTVSVEANHEGRWNNFNNNAVIIYGTQQISGNSRFSLGATTLNGVVRLQLPGEINQLSLEINHDGHINNFANSAVITIGEQEINANCEFRMEQSSFDAKVLLRTPYEGIRRATARAKFEGPINNFRQSVDLMLNGKTASEKTEFMMEGTSMTIKGDLSLPIKGYKSLSLEATHNGPIDNFRNSLTMACETGRYSANSELHINGNSVTGKAEVNLPYEPRTMSVEVNHEGNLKRFTNSAVITYGQKQLKGNTDFRLNGNNMQFKASTELPLEQPYAASVEVNHQGSIENFSNSLTIKYGEREMSTAATFKIEGTALDASVNVNGLPVKGWKKMGIEVHHSGLIKDFNNNVIVTYGKNQISANTEFSLKGNTMRGKAEINTPYIGYKTLSTEFNHEGMNTDGPYRTSATIVYGNKEISLQSDIDITANPINIQFSMTTPYNAIRKVQVQFEHDGKSWKNFNNNGMLKWNNAKYTGKSEFRWYGKLFRMKAEFRLPEEYSLKINHKGGLSDFSNNARLQLAEENISGTSSFKLAGKTLEASANIESSFKTAKNMELNIHHDGEYNNFRTRVSVTTPIKKYKDWAAELAYKGEPSDFEVTLDLNTPLRHLTAVHGTVTHKGSLSNFRSGYNVNADGTTYTGLLSYKKTARKVEANINAETPFTGFERMSASATHTGDISNFQTSVNMESTYPGYDRASVEVSHQGTWNEFRSTAKIETPFSNLPSFTVSYNHRGNYNMLNCDLSVEYAGETSTGAISYQTKPNGVEASYNIQTPYRGYEKFAASFEHSSSGNEIHTTGSLETPFAGYNRFTGEFTHTGSLDNFRTTLSITTPFTKIPSLNVAINNEYTANQVSMAASAEYSGKRLAASVTYATTSRGFETRYSIDTPYTGYENFAGSLIHNGDLRNFKTEGEMTTSIRGYRSFSWSLEHNGDFSNFQTSLSIVTPFSRFERSGLNINHNCNAQGFKTGAAVTTSVPGYENFGVEVEKSGSLKDLKFGVTVTTPIQHYETMKIELTHKCSPRQTMTNVDLTTSYPGYQNMGMKLEYTGTMEEFTSGITLTSSIRGYENFVLKVEKKGTLNNLQGIVHVETPFRKYRNMDLTISHNGQINDFTTNVRADTSIPGYGRFSGRVSHSGTIDQFQSNAQVESSVRGYEKFAFNMNHEGSLRKFKTNGNVETPFPGHESYSYNINHNYGSNIRSSAELQGPSQRYSANVDHQVNGDSFDTNVRVNTPFQGYERFGFVLNHQSQNNGFSHTGTIELPFRKLPEIKYTVQHNGHLYDFTSSAKVEYNNKKIETSAVFKRTSTRGGTIYEGTMSIKTPFARLRDFSMTGSHNRRVDIKSGAFDVEHNGEKKVDFDYSYATDGPTTVTINIRNPHPMETRINVNVGDSGVTGDAYVNWNLNRPDSNMHSNVVVNIQPTAHEVTVTMTLPTRTMAVSSVFSKTNRNLNHNAYVQWNADENSKVGYELELSESGRRSQSITDGRLKVYWPNFSAEGTFNNKIVPGRKYTTEVTVQTDKRMSLSSDLTLNQPSFTHVLTVSHPDLRRDAVITTEGTWDTVNVIYDGRVEVQVSRDTASFTGRVAKEAAGKYMASARLSHPNSLTDFQFSGQVEDTPETAMGSMETKWMMSADREFRTNSLRAEINKLRKELNMNIVTPIKEIHIAGRQLSAEAGIFRYSGELTAGELVLRGEAELNKPELMADLKVFYTQNDFVHAYAKYTNDHEIKAEVYREQSGQRIQDILLQMTRQEDGQSLNGRTYVRPELWNDIKTAVGSEDYSGDWARLKRIVRDSVTEEYNLKAAALERTFRPIIRVYNSLSTKVMEAAKVWRRTATAKLTEMKNKVKEMYANNAYHMKDICEWAQRMMEKTRENYTVVKTNVYDASAATATSASDMWDRLKDLAADLKERTTHHVTRLSDQYAEFDLQPHIDNARDTLTEYSERVRNHESVQTALDWVASIRESWTASQSGASAVVATGEKSWVGYTKELMTQLARREDVRAARDYIHNQLQNTQWANDYSDARNMVNRVLEEYKESGVAGLKTRAREWMNDNLKMDKNTFTKWMPEEGDYEFELYIPLPLEDLKTMPRVNIRLGDYIRSAYRFYQDYLADWDWSISDLYYRYKPSSNPRDWVPPFDSYASVAGNQHFMTFDKRFYEFAGDCSYLLARDFIDGTFAVVVNFERVDGRAAKKSITAYLGDKQVEIFTDGKIIMDNARMEMPVSVDHLEIARYGNQLKLTSTKGINIICNLAHDHCTVEVSGWYFSRTAGLLGTYNNEPVDDLTTIDKRQVTNVGEFAASWATTSRCRPINSAIDVSNEVTTGQSGYEICSKYFHEASSPYRRCFAVVKPEPFMTMCLNEIPVNSNRMPSEQDTCNVASFYKEQCARKGVPIQMENACVRCQKPNGEIYTQGQNLTLRGDEVPEAADVVFVIEQAACNREIVDQLKTLVDDMEKAFAAEGMTATRYAIVGYGGQGIYAKPHVHTMEGQIFNTRDKILLATDDFQTDAGQSHDAFDAIRFAAHLQFNTGVSKSVVLLRCSSCQQGPVTFSEVQQLLLVRDIRFHVLLEHNFELRGSSPKTAYIFGADSETAYTRKDGGSSNLNGDPDLRKIMRMPKDLCVALTEETGGSVFNTLQWIKNRPAIQKKYRDVLVRVIADKAEPTDCQICDCLPDEVGAGVSVCSNCVRPNPIYDLLPPKYTFDTNEPSNESTPPPPTKTKTPRNGPKRRNFKNERQTRRLKMQRNRQRS